MEPREPPTEEAALRRRLAQLEREVAQLRAALLDAERDLSGMRQLEADLAELRALSEDEQRALEAEREEWAARYRVVVGSASWRVTGGLRRLSRLLRGS